MSEINEMGAVGISGFQLPLGAKDRKDEIDDCIRESRDINEAHVLVALKRMSEDKLREFYDALDLGLREQAADMVREQVIREAVRTKIREVVRKRAGGGGYTLYAPNRGKKKAAKPVATFPTKLAAKRAELARFPPKDPKKLQRLRKEIEKLLKDPKKRAEAERRAMQQRGTDTPRHHAAGHARGKHFESKILARAIMVEAKKQMSEGLFREEAPGSAWDEFVKKVSDKSIKSDRGFQKVMAKMDGETQTVLGKALKMIQREIGASARVKPMGVKKHQDGRSYIGFKLETEDASVGPIYVYAQNGVPRVEMSDEAKAAVSKIEPATAKSIRAALSSAQDSLENVGNLQALTGERDAYLSNMEANLDKQISAMSPVQLSMLKRLLVKKYRGTK